MPKSQTESHASNKWAGKLFLCLIGVMLIAIGGVFSWLMYRSYQHASATRTWTEVPAEVILSKVESRIFTGSPEEYKLELVYEYDFEGEKHRSNKLTIRGSKWGKEKSRAESLASDYPRGSSHTAWVNPEDPGIAVLKHDTKAAGYSIWFPGIIVLGGAGMIWGVLRKN